MELRVFKVKELTAFLESAQFDRLDMIPISMHRGLSQAANPRAEEEDEILFASFDGDTLCGFMGVLPDNICSFEPQKVGWVTCFWVAEEYRSKGVAVGLLMKLMQSWDRKILITNNTPELDLMFEQTRMFQRPMIKKGLRIYLRFNLKELLPPKKPIFKTLRPLWVLADGVANFFNSIRLGISSVNQPSDRIKVELPAQIDSESAAFIQSQNSLELLRRGPEMMDWMVNHPWILQAEPGSNDSERYYYTSVAIQFVTQRVKMTDASGQVIAFFIYTIRDGHISVPYFYASDGLVGEVARYLIGVALISKLNMITVFHPALKEFMAGMQGPFLFRKEINRKYHVSKDLEISQDAWVFQDGDGDVGFTG